MGSVRTHASAADLHDDNEIGRGRGHDGGCDSEGTDDDDDDDGVGDSGSETGECTSSCRTHVIL